MIGQTFWEGALASTAAQEGLDLGRTLANLEEKDLLVPSAGTRLAGEREYAFKHVLIRDVAYSMLPKSVRCRKHVEVAEFVCAPASAATASSAWSPSTSPAPRRSDRGRARRRRAR